VNVGTTWVHTSGPRLVLGAVSPSWRGIRSVSRDPAVGYEIDRFVQLAGQYVLRGRMVRAIGALAAVYSIVVDFRSADVHRVTAATDILDRDVRVMKEQLRRTHPPDAGSRSRRVNEVTRWVEALNPLDPIIHRGVFQLWRAVSLSQHDFMAEAITALDGLSAVAAEASRLWCGIAAPTRSDVARCLGLPPDDGDRLEFLYQLRCAFGAHPPPTKWWDFGEIYEAEIDELFDVSRRVLWQLASLERTHRRIEPAPERWSAWFVENAEWLLEVTWFLRTP
jgi:hypothetical protein